MFSLTQSKARTRFAFKFKAATWCALIALITAFAFVSLVTTAATHLHSTVQETQDCSICGVVTNKIGSGLSSLSLSATQFFLLFAALVVALLSANYIAPAELPPSCGPPRA